MLPLAVGLPVALVDHLDRSSEKQLLRGKVGTADSWILREDERSREDQKGSRVLSHVPRVVFVKSHTEEWILPGLPPGVYPVYATARR